MNFDVGKGNVLRLVEALDLKVKLDSDSLGITVLETGEYMDTLSFFVKYSQVYKMSH